MDVHAQTGIKPVPTLKTKRMILRSITAVDADFVVHALNDWNVTRWLTHVPFPYAHADFDWYLREMCSDPDDTIWVMEMDGQMIGVISIGGELGYWLHPNHHGQGLMSEAGRVTCDWHFGQSDDDLRSGYHVGNDASCNVLRKLGFVETDLHRDIETARGEKVDVQKMQLSKEDWVARHA